MKRYRWILLIALVAAAASFTWLRFATHDTPTGQPELSTLDANSLDAFRGEFNRESGKTRVSSSCSRRLEARVCGRLPRRVVVEVMRPGSGVPARSHMDRSNAECDDVQWTRRGRDREYRIRSGQSD